MYVLIREFFVSKIVLSTYLIRKLLTIIALQTKSVLRLFYGFFDNLLSSNRAQVGITIGIVILLITIKGPSMSQSGILGNIVRHYTEETSASIARDGGMLELVDINSLMGSGSSSQSIGQGGSEINLNLEPQTYAIQEGSIQAVDSVSLDYLNDLKPNKIVEYTVQPGDVLSFIASDFGVSTESIIWANNLTNIDDLSLGQILRIPPVSGVIHKVKKGDTVSSIAAKYSAESSRITSFNGLEDGSILIAGKDMVIPNGVPPKHTPPPTIAKSKSVSKGSKPFAYLVNLGDYFKIPATGSNWGVIHGRNGVDVANSCGTPVQASADGVVEIAFSSGWNGGFGNYIKIVHPNGTETLYAHLSKLLITKGATVTKGQGIGLMGTTGRSTGCHLHFEVHGARNPLAK